MNWTSHSHKEMWILVLALSCHCKYNIQ